MRDNLKINGKCNNKWQSMRFVVIKIINTYYYTLLKEKIVLGLNDINFLLFILFLIQFSVYFYVTCCVIYNLWNNHWENVIYTHLCVSLACNIIWLLWRPMMLFFPCTLSLSAMDVSFFCIFAIFLYSVLL